MEIIMIHCPKCKGKIHVEEGTKKCFCMYCRSEVMVREAGNSGSVTLDSLVRRGFLSLEFSDWEKALEVFDQAANINPEFALIYVGKLLAELKLKFESQLPDHANVLSNYASFQKAVRFADASLKERLVGYDKAIKKRLAQVAQRDALDETAKREALLAKQKLNRLEDAAVRRQRALDAPKRRMRAIIFASLAVLFVVFFVARNRNAEQARFAAEIARIEERIATGYHSWVELVDWANNENIIYEFRVGDDRPTDELLDQIEAYGLHDIYLFATAQRIFTDNGDDVALVLHFEVFSYLSAVAALHLLDKSSEIELNDWLEYGGLEQLEEVFSEIVVLDLDEFENPLPESTIFEMRFVSWHFEASGSAAYGDRFITISRQYELLTPTREEVQNMVLEAIDLKDQNQYIPFRTPGNYSASMEMISDLLDIPLEILELHNNAVRLSIHVRALNEHILRLSEYATEDRFSSWRYTYHIAGGDILNVTIIQRFYSD